MSVSDTEKSLRRRILFRALDDGTPVDVVQKAIDLLDNEFGANPEIRYGELIKRLQESFDHEAFRSTNLLGRIMLVRNKPVSEIGPDPSQTLTETATPAVAEPEVILSGRDLVFNTLLSHITKMVAKRTPDGEAAYRKHFLSEVLKMKLSSSCGAKLVSWAKGSASMSSISGSNEELHKIINTAFVWMCGKFGPVVADQVLLHAIKQTEQLSEAFEFPPRDFL